MGSKTPNVFLKSLAVVVCWSAVVQATKAGENWTSYRGPTDQGHCDSAALPQRWSEDENVAWKTPLAGKAWSSPVIWQGQIWLTIATADGRQMFAVCVDRSSGRIVHDVKVLEPAKLDHIAEVNSYASPTPAVSCTTA